jgi:hypothetical protein
MSAIDQIQQIDENGAVVTGVFTDSLTMPMGEEDLETTIHFTATVTALSTPTVIPTELQSVLGESIDLDFLITVTIEEETGESIKFGLTLTAEEQTLLQYSTTVYDPNDKSSSSLVFSSMDPTDSSFVFKGARYNRYDNAEEWNFVFDLSSQSISDFACRTSWFSNSITEIGELRTIVGGGNKDVEFALCYRVYNPPDTIAADTATTLSQVFGPEYTEGTSLISAYSDYVAESTVIRNDELPSGMITDPWADQ